jgi:hypothetical protein
VADWGLAHFDSEEAITRSLIARLAEDVAHEIESSSPSRSGS